MKRTTHITILLAATATLSACRVEPGTTDYASQQPGDFIDETDMGEDTFLPGPDPYDGGQTRLTFGPFYEGASSDEIPINDVTNFFFVFTADGVSSLDIVPSDDRIEGFSSDEFRLVGTSFWGMSLAFFDGNPDDGADPRPEDLSAWETLNISFKSSDSSFRSLEIGLMTTEGESRVVASDYGWASDGEWHTLEVPLADFGADLTSVHTPLILAGVGGAEGDALLVDNFYYEGP